MIILLFLCFFDFPFSLFQCIGVAGVCTYLVPYMLWHGIVLLLSTWYNVAACVVVLVTTELVPLQDEESAPTLGVLDVNEYKERFNVKKKNRHKDRMGIKHFKPLP